MPAGPWRVRDRATFAELRRSGRTGRSGPLRVTWSPGPPGSPPRLAMSVGRTVGTAVVRNRLRRRLRALVAERLDDLAPGTYLLTAARAAADLSYGELRDHLMTALSSLPTSP